MLVLHIQIVKANWLNHVDILPPAPDRTSNLLSTLERITDPFLWAPARCRRAEPLLSRGPTHSRSKLSYCDFSPRPIFAYLCRQVAQPAHEPKVNIIIIQKTYFSNPWLVPQWDQDALFGTQLRSHIYIYTEGMWHDAAVYRSLWVIPKSDATHMSRVPSTLDHIWI